MDRTPTVRSLREFSTIDSEEANRGNVRERYEPPSEVPCRLTAPEREGRAPLDSTCPTGIRPWLSRHTHLDRKDPHLTSAAGNPDGPTLPLRAQEVDPDPLRQFTTWFEQASEAGAPQPEAAAVATATPDGAPSVRYVLVKQFDERGFVFFSNYESRKGSELRANPRAALLFYWEALGRQVRIEGSVQRVAREESIAYAHRRPRGSQLGALASPQSRVIESRDWLERQVAELAERYDGQELPLPDGWGGLRIAPARYEFWQHRQDRLHDRLRYTRGEPTHWRIERLAP